MLLARIEKCQIFTVFGLSLSDTKAPQQGPEQSETNFFVDKSHLSIGLSCYSIPHFAKRCAM